MRLDDLAADLVARNASYVAALSTVGVPLTTLTAANVIARSGGQVTGKVSVFLDSLPEEIEEHAPSFRIIALPVEFVVMAAEGESEAASRERARAYATAIENCLAENAYYFGLRSREDFDGVEGNESIKATKFTLIFKYEEAV